jgi:hypothetical protein
MAEDDKAQRAAYHVEAARRRRAAESAKAQVLLEGFVREARARGLTTCELLARPWNGRGRYRTGRIGWYLKRDHSIGVDTEAAYYLLVVAPERFGRWRGVAVAAADPPLQVGEGARDGESAPLAEFLRLRLEAGDDFP